MDRGQPAVAFRITDDLADIEPWSALPLRLRVLDALYGGGDSTHAMTAVRALERATDVVSDRCVLEQWRLWRGDTSMARQTIGILASARDDAASAVTGAACAALLEALAAVRGRRADAAVAVARLDSVLSHGLSGGEIRTYGHVALARLYELLGESRRALVAIRRRPYMQAWPAYLATALREEARLAASLADTATAARVYSHVLALRSDPERSVAPTVATVRAELGRLVPRR